MSNEIFIPDDLPACQSLAGELAATVAQLAATITKLQDQNLAQKLEIEQLIKLAFGRRSERYIENPNQLKLDLGDSDEVLNAVEGLKDALADSASADEETIAAYTRQKQARKPRSEQLPAHLPRYEVTVEPTEEQRRCAEHGERQVIGHDRIETLEYRPPQLRVKVTLWPKFACQNAPQCGVKSPERKPGLVEGDRYDTSVAAAIVTGKYGYHLPIYRQQDCFASSGWTPSRSTLLNVANAAAMLIVPLVHCFADWVREDSVIGTDDTGVTLLLPKDVPAIDPDDRRSARVHEVLAAAMAKGEKSVAAKMWAYRGVHVPLNVFDFTVSRHRDGPDEFLVHSGYQGTMMGDCYTGYQGITLRSQGVLARAACNAHARRKVYDAIANHPVCATVLMAMYQELYDIENRGKTMDAAGLLELRQSESVAVWSRMRSYLDSAAVKSVLPKEVMGKSIAYLNNHWDALLLYTTNPLIPIDNNDVEQLMKQVALGRKNWMFIGSLAAGARAADLMTLVSSAVRNDLDVWAYVKDVLDQLLAGSTDYLSLRPDVWAKAHPDQIREYRRDERRDKADRKQFHRAVRRRAAAKLATDPASGS